MPLRSRAFAEAFTREKLRLDLYVSPSPDDDTHATVALSYPHRLCQASDTL